MRCLITGGLLWVQGQLRLDLRTMLLAHDGRDRRDQLPGLRRDGGPALGQCPDRMGGRAAPPRRPHALATTLHLPGIRWLR
jgi:hypothetical protein